MPKQPQMSSGSASGKAGAGKSGRLAARGRKSNNQFVLLWVIGGVLVVLIGVLLLNQQALTAGQGGSPQGASDGPSWGPVGAPVTVVEYSNFGCSHCKNFALQVEPQFRKDYEASGKVRFEFRQFTFQGGDPTMEDAANASLCAADQNRFWDYHDTLFRNQGLSATAFSKGSLKGYAKQLGLDTAAFNTCVDNVQHRDQVAQNTAEGNKLGVNGTPTFFINGTPSVGEMPYDQLKAKVEAAIKAKGG